MKKSFLLKTLASVFSTVKLPKLKPTRPTTEKKYCLAINIQRKLSLEEVLALSSALANVSIDPKVDSFKLANRIKFALVNYCDDRKPKRQIHLAIPLVSCNAKLTKRKAHYVLKPNERSVLYVIGSKSRWVLTENI